VVAFVPRSYTLPPAIDKVMAVRKSHKIKKNLVMAVGKSPHVVTVESLHGRCTRELTFQNLCQQETISQKSTIERLCIVNVIGH
jgi:hypothetical protein